MDRGNAYLQASADIKRFAREHGLEAYQVTAEFVPDYGDEDITVHSVVWSDTVEDRWERRYLLEREPGLPDHTVYQEWLEALAGDTEAQVW